MNNKLKYKENYINGNISNENLGYKEYFIQYEKNEYKILIEKRSNEILIKCQAYETNLNINNILLMNFNFYSIEEIHKYIINKFEEKKIFIKNIIPNESLTLIIKNNEEVEAEIALSNENKIKNLSSDESNDFSSSKNNIALKDNLNFNEIKLIKDLIKDSYVYYSFLDNTFCVFESIDKILYLIYGNKYRSIISFNIIDSKKINEIKNAHESYITNFRHYLDINNKRDLIITISADDNNIKLWNIVNLELLVDIQNINKDGLLYSSCFLNNNSQIYIISSNYDYSGNCEPIKVFDFNGNYIKEINSSEDKTYFIDTYHDEKLDINYIITGNKNDVKVYDFDKDDLYKKYDDNDNKGHYSVVIYNKDDIIKLIESSDDKNIRIWNFHTGQMINKINVSNKYCLNGICLWDHEYIFVGYYDKKIKLLNINKGILIKNISGHNSRVLTIKKIAHPIYGNCLISQSWDNKIKLWST